MSGEESLWQLIHHTITQSNSVEKAVFISLIVLSVVSWCIVLLKIYDLHVARRNSRALLVLFNNADRFGTIQTEEYNLGRSPLLAIFKAAMRELEARRPVSRADLVTDPRQISLKPASAPDDMLALAMAGAAQGEFGRLNRGLGFLASIGSTSPFIGLFGTVWGIMNTFRGMGAKSAVALSDVAPGIASALIATAAGLAVAIPAVMAYNWFVGQVDDLQENADAFSARVGTLVKASGLLDKPVDARALEVPARTVPVPPSASSLQTAVGAHISGARDATRPVSGVNAATPAGVPQA